MNIHLLATLVSVMIMASCSKPGQDTGEQPSIAEKPPISSQPETVPELEKPRGLILSLLPQPVPNQYFVRVAITGVISEEWQLVRTGAAGDTKVLCTKTSCGSEFIDQGTVSGTTMTYAQALSEGSESILIASASISVPQDFEVQGTVSRASLDGVNRLFLRSGSVLVTDGKDTVYTVQEIIAENAFIAAFPLGTTAPRRSVGRNGGQITVKAKTATGKLVIVGQGEIGGMGENGPVGPPGSNGTPGSTSRTRCAWPSNLQPRPPHPPTSLPRNEDQCYHWIDDYRRLNYPWAEEYTKKVMQCEFAGSHGTPGTQGFPGYPGSSGMDGGASANITVEIENPVNFDVTFDTGGGRGGQGGDGGPGGAGGQGGPAGNNDPYQACPELKQGPQGPPGAIGPRGPSGRDGASNPYCYKRGSERLGSCS